jgi:hypothetical protein
MDGQPDHHDRQSAEGVASGPAAATTPLVTPLRGASATVFIALIGTRWSTLMSDRTTAAYADPAEDYVRREIEFALDRRALLA